MRKYEVIFIVAPHLQEEEADALAQSLQKTLEKKGAALEKMEKWGKRRLAYAVAKQREGYYFLFVVDGAADAINELERKFKQTDDVIRFMTVRTDLELKAVAKRIAMRQREEAKKAAKGAGRSRVGAEATFAAADRAAADRAAADRTSGNAETDL
ncbi:MAG: 30S ribosomal protein S6 [Acidobacteria bacterium]|nr:30S ribosomal protein S6 [Acidobacteriota bacterium]